MRSLAPETRALIDRLNVARRRSLLDAASIIELIVEIEAAAAPLAAAWLLPFVFSRDPATARVAAGAIRRLTSGLAPRDYVRLDEEVRRIYGSYGWDWQLAPADLPRLADFGEDALRLFGLASFHRNGFVREKAIVWLSYVGTGEDLPYLLIRANDWVEPVRRAAADAIRERLHLSCAPALVEALPLIFRLESTGRAAHDDLVRAVKAVLSDPAAEPAVREGLRSPHREVRHLCRKLLLAQTPGRIMEHLQDALRDPDPLVRLWAARTAVEQPETGSLLFRMAQDRSGSVRGLALRTLAERVPAEAGELLERAVFDVSSSIRQETRRFLERERKIDFAARYSQALQEPGTTALLAAALGGLTETGGPPDASRVLPFLAHPSARVRRAAVRSIGSLTQTEHLAALEEMLRDSAPSVSAEARRALAGRPGLIDPERLWHLFQQEERPHVRSNALRLLAALGKWDRLPYLLRACGDRDLEIAEIAARLLLGWIGGFNQSFTTPTPAQIQKIDEALQQKGSTLEPWLLQQIEFSLGSFRRRG